MPLPRKSIRPQSAEEGKKALLQRLLAAHARSGKKTVAKSEVTPASETKTIPDAVPFKNLSRLAKAEVPITREGEKEPCTPSPGLSALANLYLEAAEKRTRHIALLWPAVPETLVGTHALATFERWEAGDKQGVRGLMFPAKANVFFPLNHLRVDREAVLIFAQALVESSGAENPAVKRGMQDKDAYLFALASLKPEQEELFNPTIGELLPRFYGGKNFTGWDSCSQQLLEHISARLKRRAHKKALQANRNVVGHPKSAPDALFAIDARQSADEIRGALLELKKCGAPEVVLINATGAIRKGTRGWAKQIARFFDVVDKVFHDHPPGVVMVVDDPNAGFQLREQLAESNLKRPKHERWNPTSDFIISAVCNGARGDGFLPAGTGKPEMPLPREFDVEVVDTEANRVIGRLYRAAARVPGGRSAAGPILDAAGYLSRLAALPCGVATLVDWLSTSSTSEYARKAFSWSNYHAALTVFQNSEACGQEQKEIQECLAQGTKIYEHYQTATPFAMRLAELVGTSVGLKKRKTVLVFTSAIYRRLAQRFFSEYVDFPQGLSYSQLSEHVVFLLSSELEESLSRIGDARLIFAGIDADGLRLLMLDNRIGKHTAILLTARSGQYLRGMLKILIERFVEFKQLKPRMESILRQLSSLPEDRSILSLGDFTLPTFRPELNQEASENSEVADPEACSIILENQQTLFRRPTQCVYVYDPASEHASERGFKACEVQTLRPGDMLFVMSTELRELVEAVLKEAGVPIQHDKTFETALRGYHQIVKSRLQVRYPGKNLSEQVRTLRDALLDANPHLVKDFPAVLSVRHWVNLGESADKPFESLQPQAPMKEAHFLAFARALGFSDLEASYYWQGVIMPVRNARRLDGRHVSDLYAHMLLQPESAMLHSNIRPATVKMLFSKARDNLIAVEAITLPIESTTR